MSAPASRIGDGHGDSFEEDLVGPPHEGVLCVGDLVDANVQSLALGWIAGAEGSVRPVVPAERARPRTDASDLIGHFNLIHPQRIQVLGVEEVEFIEHLEAMGQQALYAQLVRRQPPAIIIADGLPVPGQLQQTCGESGIPLLTSPLHAGRVIDLLRIYLSRVFAETVSMHGVYLDVLGMGVLVSGESGLGKSELALELVSRGHGLVADDVVDFTRVAPSIIEGRCPPLLRNLIEVRGLGLLDVKTIFGETAVRRKMRLKLIVQLVRPTSIDHKYARMPLSAQTQEILGIPIRKVVLPVAEGRNLAVLTEVAVRNTILQLRGIDSMQIFLEQQRQQMSS